MCFIDYAKAFDCVSHNKWWKVPKAMWILEQVICLQEICMQVNKQQLEPGMEQWTGSKLGNVYIKAVYYHTAYLTFMHHVKCCAGWSTDIIFLVCFFHFIYFILHL